MRQKHLDLLRNQSGLDWHWDKKTKTVTGHERVTTLGYPSRRNHYWKPLFKSIDEKFDVQNKVLPSGTTLYRGSLSSSPSEYPNARLVYFGLDLPISAWAVVEAFQKRSENWSDVDPKEMFGFLHAYKTTAPIPYKYTKTSGVPSEDAKCLGHPCVHAQTIFHNKDWLQVQEIGTEFSFPPDFSRESVRPVKTYKLNVNMMMTHQVFSMLQWNPANALLHYEPRVTKNKSRVTKNKSRVNYIYS